MQSSDLSEDIKNCEWIVEKLKKSESYAQNLYAAFCNVTWQKRDTWPILKEETWSVSWRTSGAIIAELRNCNETYIDWYCSGIYSHDEETDGNTSNFVAEGIVTDEIQKDLEQLKWFVHTVH